MTSFSDAIKIVDAAKEFTRVWRDLATTLPGDYSCTFTCSEAEVLAALFRATGDTESAEEIISRHAETDEPGDSHYEVEGEES